jgi:hypothetical protein
VGILIAIGLAVSTGNLLYGALSGLAWGFFADSIVGILFALAVIGGLGAFFGVAT